jgi:hypothetical protein
MTTAAEIADKIMTAWAKDKNIQDYCRIMFNKKPQFRNAIDENNPPGEKDFPIIAFYDWRSSGGMAGMTEKFEFLVGIALVERCVIVDDDLNIWNYCGPGRIEALRSLAERAVRSARIGKVTWEGSENPLTDFPLFTALSVITVETPNPRTRP